MTARPLRVDIGGGLAPRPGFVNLDPVHGQGDWKRQAQDTPWPCGDGDVDRLNAFHCLEHIPAGADRIAVMNEAWRVLRPGGVFQIHVPAFPHNLAVADPTHVSYWVPESFAYFTRPDAADADYGIRLWEMVSIQIIDRGFPEIQAVLRKP